MASFFETSKGKPKLAYNGFCYVRDKPYGSKIYWRCDIRGCSGRVTTENDTVIREAGHTLHGPDSSAVEIKKSVSRIKKVAFETFEPPSGIINREISQNLPNEYLGYAQKPDTLRRTIQRKRKQNTPALSVTLNDIDLSGQYSLSASGDQFLLSDDTVGEERVICFGTNQNMRYLCASKIWYGDGTFSIAPGHFYQLYTIHSEVLGETYPLLYVVATCKSKQIYENIFNSIKFYAEENEINIVVETFRSDYEVAAMKGFLSIFPHGSVEGCFFHFAQANWRKLVDLGLRQTYINDETVSIHVRMLTALAFLPPEKVAEVFQEITDSFPEELCDFVSYFGKTYVGFYNYTSRFVDGKMVSI